ncbi:uncharacterized protein LOC132735662 [Ruditapes philippinarum]|uniref:uncharacterized protein LOC132735662 n=1 Tax=Ruditapes philippinarum TaxID=129788 RepID=UPI00295B459A|nr:uncharacterized protein LOC132735662 [Ruditapes philippinarum]
MVLIMLVFICIFFMGSTTVETRYIASNQRLQISRVLQRRPVENMFPNNVLYRRNQRVISSDKGYNSYSGRFTPPRTKMSSGNSFYKSSIQPSKENSLAERRLGSFESRIHQQKSLNKLTFPDRKRKLQISLKFNEPNSADTNMQKHVHIKSKNVNDLKISHGIKSTKITIDRDGSRTGIHLFRRPALRSNNGIRNVYHPKHPRTNHRRKPSPFNKIQRPTFHTQNGELVEDGLSFQASTFNPKSWIIDNIYKPTARVQTGSTSSSVVSTSVPFSVTKSTVQVIPKSETTPTIPRRASTDKPKLDYFVSVSEISATTNGPSPSTVTEELDLPDSPDVPDLPEVPEYPDSTTSAGTFD